MFLSRYLNVVSPNINQCNWLLLLRPPPVLLLSNVVSLPCACQLHARLHLFMGDPGPHAGHVTRHVFPLHPQRDAASPHAASVRAGGSRTQLGGDLLGGHPDLHMVSSATKCFKGVNLSSLTTRSDQVMRDDLWTGFFWPAVFLFNDLMFKLLMESQYWRFPSDCVLHIYGTVRQGGFKYWDSFKNDQSGGLAVCLFL